MAPKRLERQIDDALLATATWAGFVYVRRRFRRLLSHAAVAATIAGGVGAIGLAGAAVAWCRSRARRVASK
jgi:hypothetical protein